MGRHVFCSDLCRARGEPIEGMGDAPERILMLAWPRGKWRTPRWEAVDMSPALSAALHGAAQAGLHVALVDKVEDPGALATLHALPEGIRAEFDAESDLVAAIEAYVEGTVFAGRPDSRITVICCTDSRRDACCARHGFATYKALTAIADPRRFHIVQATHIGGCRFAASLLVMPAVQRYGRMTPDQAPDFLAALTRGEIYLPAYKGRSGRPEGAQVAELAAMRWAAERGHILTDIPLEGDIPAQPTDGMRLTLAADVAGARLAIRLQARTFMVQSSCETVAQGGGANVLRWCLDDIHTVATPQTACPAPSGPTFSGDTEW